jgi:hypothetical protein
MSLVILYSICDFVSWFSDLTLFLSYIVEHSKLIIERFNWLSFIFRQLVHIFLSSPCNIHRFTWFWSCCWCSHHPCGLPCPRSAQTWGGFDANPIFLSSRSRPWSHTLSALEVLSFLAASWSMDVAVTPCLWTTCFILVFDYELVHVIYVKRHLGIRVNLLCAIGRD